MAPSSKATNLCKRSSSSARAPSGLPNGPDDSPLGMTRTSLSPINDTEPRGRSTQAFGDVRGKATYQCDLVAGEPARRVGAMQVQHTPALWAAHERGAQLV